MYSDDWGFILSYFTENSVVSSPFSADRFTHFMNVYANRPISGLMYYIVNSVCGYNLAMVHSIVIAGVLATAYTFYLFAGEFIQFIGNKNYRVLGAVTSLIWLVSPWTLGVTTWYSSSINMLAFIFFSLSLYYMFKGLNNDKKYYVKVGLFYLLSCFTYESFFFQFIIFIAIIWLYKEQKNIDKSILIRYAIMLASVAIVSVIWNRLSATLFEQSIHKVFNPYFIQTLAVNIVSFPYVLFKSFGTFDWLVAILSIPIISYLKLKLVKENGGLKKLFVNINIKIALLLVLGIFAGILIYSAAGYTMWGMGSRSRTMYVASFYMPLIMIIFGTMVSNLRGISSKFKYAIGYTFIALAFVSTFSNKLDWVKAENEQRAVINSFPAEKVSELDSNDMVVVVAPFRHKWISQFDAPWSIDFQMQYGKSFYNGNALSKMTDAQFAVGRGIKHPASNKNYQVYWDGEYMYQGYNLEEGAKNIDKNFFYNRADRFTAKRLFVWNYYKGTFEQITEPQLLEYEPFYNYDYWVTWVYHNWLK